jgi:DNA-directed RNA polymerase subunit K/omega
MTDYKQTTAPRTTITRDMNELTEKVGNVYETVAIIGKRSNQISTAMKKELDAKLQDFSIPQDSADETFENLEQIEISKNYEQLPKATLIATQEFIENELIYRGSNRDELLK